MFDREGKAHVRRPGALRGFCMLSSWRGLFCSVFVTSVLTAHWENTERDHKMLLQMGLLLLTPWRVVYNTGPRPWYLAVPLSFLLTKLTLCHC